MYLGQDVQELVVLHALLRCSLCRAAGIFLPLCPLVLTNLEHKSRFASCRVESNHVDTRASEPPLHKFFLKVFKY